MSSNEFADWIAYYQLQPFGPYRGDVQAAMVACTIANANAKKGTHYAPKDFIPKFVTPGQRAQEDRMKPSEVRGFFQLMQAAHQGRAS